MFQEVLLKRFSILKNGKESPPSNAIEKAVDLHATTVIGSSGFQKCIHCLWKGWVSQDLEDPMQFTGYKHIANKNFWVHFDHDRIRAPKYQNLFQVMVSILYLVLYTASINTMFVHPSHPLNYLFTNHDSRNSRGDIDTAEGILYILTLSFIADEMSKLRKVGILYLSFWNVFNLTLYFMLGVSFVLRMIALAHPLDSEQRRNSNTLSYNFLACVSPLIWSRMLLYLDSIRFFGAMLVVLKGITGMILYFLRVLMI